MRAASLALCVVIVVAIPARVAAHGGRLQTQHVLLAPGGRVVSLATFGLLTRDDASSPFRWMCQESIPDAVAGITHPGLVAGDRLLLAGNFGLVRGALSGCAWEHEASLRDRFVPDVVRAPDGAVLTLTGDGGRENFVHRSDDDGATFAPIGAPLPAGLLPDRLRVAPSDGARIYVVGTAREAGSIERRAVVARSDDGARSWRALGLGALEEGERVVRGLAVDPRASDVLFVVVQGDVHDRLMRTADAGETWHEVVRLAALPGAIDRPFALAIAPGGDVFFGNTGTGLHVLRAGGALDALDVPVALACLVLDGETMWACGDGLLDGFALARFPLEGPLVLAPALRFDEITRRSCEGALECACDPWWDDFLLEAERAPEAPACGADDAGIGAPPATPHGGCGCAVGAAPRGASAIALLALVAASLRRRRVRHRAAHRARAASGSSE